MRLNDPDAYRTTTELDAIAQLVDIRGARVLELGCGDGANTVALVERFGVAEVVATDVDRVQLSRLQARDDLPRVRFRYGGAEAIEAPDAAFDAVFLFKSLHHVPVARMDRALSEIHRVLKLGAPAVFVEPVYWGPFNALLSLIHEEEAERVAAFAALEQVVAEGRFDCAAEVFVQVPATIPDWDAFAARYLAATYLDLSLDAEQLARVRAAFDAHLTPSGAHFLKPNRIDVLRKRGASREESRQGGRSQTGTQGPLLPQRAAGNLDSPILLH